jgi:hypothetical protein
LARPLWSAPSEDALHGRIGDNHLAFHRGEKLTHTPPATDTVGGQQRAHTKKWHPKNRSNNVMQWNDGIRSDVAEAVHDPG